MIFSECFQVHDDRAIRQGDIFEWLLPSEDSSWSKMGIVVTANCDIVKEKHNGIISYVPVLELRDYLAQFFLTKRISPALDDLGGQLVKNIHKLQKKYLPQFPQPMSKENALRWVLDSTTEELVSQLGVPAGQSHDTFVTIVNDYVRCKLDLLDGSFDRLLNGLIRIRIRNTPKARAQVMADIWKEIESFVINLPGDAFFLGNILDGYPSGFIAYLRLIREANQHQIAIKQTDLRDGTMKAKRIACLSSPYIYRLTQQLASVFSDIGLPAEYEKARVDVVKRHSQDYC